METPIEAELISIADELSSLSQLGDLLAAVAKRFASDTCIIWEVQPLKDPQSLDKALMFPLAQWSAVKPPWRRIDVPMKSMTGKAVLTNKPQKTKNALKDPITFKDDPWLSDIGPSCSCPIVLRDQASVVAQGAVTLYRQIGQPPYSTKDLKAIDSAVRHLPFFAQYVRNRTAYDVIRKLDILLDSHPPAPSTHDEEILQAVLSEVQALLAESFRCRHVSVYLRSSDADWPLFRDVVSTKPIHRYADLPKDKVTRLNNPGVGTWCLRKGVRALVLDLRQYQRDLHYLTAQFETLSAADLRSELDRMRAAIPEPEDEVLSFTAAPIMDGETPLGLLICCGVRGEPHYFSEPESKLLDMVAKRLGPYIHQIRQYDELRGETDAWRNLVRTVKDLNQRVSSATVDQASEDFLSEAAKQIRQFQKVDLACIHWHLEATALSTPSRAIEAALGKQSVRQISEKELDSLKYHRGEGAIDLKARHVILAEIACGVRYGVLSLTNLEAPFPSHSAPVAEVLGQLFGLYRSLGDKMEQLVKQRRSQAQAFTDLRHQIRSPILQAYRHVVNILSARQDDRQLTQSLNAVRGLTSRGLSVANCVALYAELAEGKEISLNLKDVTVSQLRQKLIESAIDHETIFLPSKNVRFEVLKETFNEVENLRVRIDLDLVIQCIGNLLENAGKYSYRDKYVKIYASFTNKRLTLAVGNAGIPLSKDDVANCAKRHWRSDFVKTNIRDVGQGIGLWIVSEVMKSHKGVFEPVPTTISNYTEFKLLFPLER